MAITTQGKLNELRQFQKTDGSIQVEYNNVDYQYKKTKGNYKISKQDYKLAQEKLELAKQELDNAPLLKLPSASRKVKNAKKILKLKKQKYLLDKEMYKQRLKDLRRLKSEIRNQYKSHRQYVKFFKNVQEAQKMGINLPKYLTDEYTKQKNMYISEKYSIDKTGKRHYISQTDKTFNRDVSSLIWEKNKENIKNSIDKTIEQTKNYFNSNEDKER